MCAIVGMVNGRVREGGWQQHHRTLAALLVAAQNYGPDATGFVAHTCPFKNPLAGKIVTDKAPLRASDFVRHNPAWRRLCCERSQTVLGHVRWATHGSPKDNRNNHPFVSRNRRYFLVHNGVIANHADVDERHQLARDGECDSESLLRLVEKIDDPRIGLAACLREFQGSMAIALFDARTELLWLATNGGRPLWVCQLRREHGWLFASTREILNRAIARSYGEGFDRRIRVQLPLAPMVIHAIAADGELLATDTASIVKDRLISEDED